MVKQEGWRAESNVALLGPAVKLINRLAILRTFINVLVVLVTGHLEPAC